MLIYKLFGGGVLLLCGFLYPRLRAGERREARLEVEKLIELIACIRRQIEYYRLPVREILLRCDRELLSYFGGERESLSGLFEGRVWREAGVDEVAMQLAASLGRGFYAEQLRLCDAAIAELSAIREKLSASEEKRAKTEGVLSLGITALAVILLL